MSHNTPPMRVGPFWLPIAVGVAVVIGAAIFDLSAEEWAAVAFLTLLTLIGQHFDSITTLTFGKDKIEIKRLQREVTEAKELAALSVELAAEMTKVPTDRMDGGLWEDHDAVFALAFRRLEALGFSDAEIDRTFLTVQPDIGRRILFSDLNKIDLGKHPAAPSVLANASTDRPRLLPREAIALLETNGVPASEAIEAVSNYKRWFESSTKMRTFLEIVRK